VFVLVSLLVGACSVGTHDELLDGLQRDAQSVTPEGTREVRLDRYWCGEAGDDSSPVAVVRVLNVEGRTKLVTARDKIIGGFVRRGWTRNTNAPRASATTEDRVLWVRGTKRTITVEVIAPTVLC
jgi:hypothetical protein